MKIVWNNNGPKSLSDSDTPQISLPTPSGQWISIEDEATSEITASESSSSKEIVHIPEISPFQSIQEINIFDQEKETTEQIDATEKIEITEIVMAETTVEDTAAEPVESNVAEVEIEFSEVVMASNTTSANNQRFQEHQHELRQMAVFCLSIFTMSLLPYTTPALADYRPWTADEAPPLIGLWTNQGKMTEDASGALVAVTEPMLDSVEEEFIAEEQMEEPLVKNVDEEEALGALNEIAIVVPTEDHLEPLEPRSPAKPERLHVPNGSMDKYFTQLSLIEDGTDRVARALVWGDSTIANDGIIKDVRIRMQDRFGDSGPGFLAAKVDKRWAFRRDIVRNVEGPWSAKNIVHGGAEDARYGLAGTVGIAHPDARSTLGGIKIEGERQDLNRFQVFYQRNPNGGQLNVSTQSTGKVLNTKADTIRDAYYELTVPSGDPYVYLEAQNSDVVIYGVALEVDAPGVTWETFGVAGSSISSMQKQHDTHLSEQIAARDPSLLVYWTGGNELGYPSLKSKTGKSYKKYYRKVVQNLKSGAPQASCLLIGPLDQAMRENGQIISKPTLDKIIRFQREVAEEEGCAYWDARAAMGGANAFRDWLAVKPALASPDLAHLTGRGRKRIGDTLADVLMREYELWRIDNPDVFWTPEESIADPTGDLWMWECENPELSVAEMQDMESHTTDICSL